MRSTWPFAQRGESPGLQMHKDTNNNSNNHWVAKKLDEKLQPYKISQSFSLRFEWDNAGTMRDGCRRICLITHQRELMGHTSIRG